MPSTLMYVLVTICVLLASLLGYANTSWRKDIPVHIPKWFVWLLKYKGVKVTDPMRVYGMYNAYEKDRMGIVGKILST